MSTMAEITVFPVTQGSLSPSVAEALKAIEATGITYELGPMGTTVEGDFDQVFEACKAAFKAVAKGEVRVSMSVRIDHKPGEARMRKKVASVQEKMG